MRFLLVILLLWQSVACLAQDDGVLPPSPSEIQQDRQYYHGSTYNGLLPNLKEPSGEYLLLADCLRMAYFQHPNLQSDIQGVVAAEARLRIVDASYLPTFALTSDSVQEAEPTTIRFNAVAVGVTQTIWDTGQRAKRAKAARADLRAAVRQFQSTWIGQVQSVVSSYISLLEAEYLKEIQEDNVRRTKLNYDVAKAFYASGVKSMIDVTTAEIQMSQARVSLASAENSVRVARIALAQAVGVDVKELENRPLEDLLMRESVVPNRADALTYLEEFHPSLVGLADQAEASFATAEAARRGNAPVLTGSAFYGNGGVVFPQTPIWQVQLTLSFPFYTPSVEPTGDASEAEGQQLLAQREAEQLLLIQQLDTAISDIQGARDRADRAVEAVQQALSNGDLAFRRYRFGLSDITELINARSFIESSRVELVRALSDMKSAEASFVQAMGHIPLPPGVPEDSPFLQLNLTEEETREEALEKAVPHRPGPNERRP